MNIVIKKGIPEEISVRVVATAMIIHSFFGPYKQDTVSKEELEKDGALLFVPVLQFDPKSLTIKDKALDCHARFVVYSKHGDAESKPCERLINESACTDRIKWIAVLPKHILRANVDSKEETTIQDLFNSLVDPEAVKTSYYYQLSDEETTTHSLAIVNEYGNKKDPICITTAYFSIKGK